MEKPRLNTLSDCWHENHVAFGGVFRNVKTTHEVFIEFDPSQLKSMYGHIYGRLLNTQLNGVPPLDVITDEDEIVWEFVSAIRINK